MVLSSENPNHPTSVSIPLKECLTKAIRLEKQLKAFKKAKSDSAFPM